MPTIAEVVKQVLPNSVYHLEDLIVFASHDVQRRRGPNVYLFSNKVRGTNPNDTNEMARNERRNIAMARDIQRQHPEWIVICSSEIMEGNVRRNLNLFPSTTGQQLAYMWPRIIQRGGINGIITGPEAHLSTGSLAEQAIAHELGLPIIAAELPMKNY